MPRVGKSTCTRRIEKDLGENIWPVDNFHKRYLLATIEHGGVQQTVKKNGILS